MCLDVGSTFTKATLLDPDDGGLLGRAQTPTTIGTDVLDGMREVCRVLTGDGHRVPDLEVGAGQPGDRDRVLVCSSAGGGLRLAVVGYEAKVTAEAGHRVGLSAGARVEHVSAGAMHRADVTALRRSRPDVVLLVGGTDGGNADVVVHNARRLAQERVGAPIVVAGNAAAAGRVQEELAATGRSFVVADNVLPRIGVVEPASARAAIRTVFLEHVIGGKGLSRGPRFAGLVRAATPDAVLAGVEALAARTGQDVMVLDIGGATTDVYSVLSPEGEDASLRKHVVAPLWHARTVEGDLGMRWGAAGVLAAARAEGLPDGDDAALQAWVEQVSADPGRVPCSAAERELDLTVARLAAVAAVRRHARPGAPGEAPRPLVNVRHLVGSGGVLRHHPAAAAASILHTVLADHGGGWRPPEAAHPAVDTAYLLHAAGLLANDDADLAGQVAGQVADHVAEEVRVVT